MKDILPVFAHSSRVEIIVDWRNLLDVNTTFSSLMYVKIVVGMFCTVDKEVNDFYEDLEGDIGMDRGGKAKAPP